MRRGGQRRICVGGTGSATRRVQPEGQVWRSEAVGGVAAEGLEDENRRLKKLLAEAVMDNSVLRELLRKN
jgi:hypothetical protein